MVQDPEAGYGLVDKVRNLLRLRRSAYLQTFGGEGASRTVLKDLARFCRANDTTFRPNDREHVLLEGRREVWLRIQRHLNMSVEEIFQLTIEDTRKKR